MADAYGIDPRILANCTIPPPLKRSEQRYGVGFGAPIYFKFSKDNVLSENWNVTGYNSTEFQNELELNVGFLRFIVKEYVSNKFITINRPFSTQDASITIAFKLRVSTFSRFGHSNFYLRLPSDTVYLNWTYNDGSSSVMKYETKIDGDFKTLCESKIKADDSWHNIVMTIQPDKIKLWEDDFLMFDLILSPEIGENFDINFYAPFTIGLPSINASVDISDISVVIGLNRNVKPNSSLQNENEKGLDQTMPYVKNYFTSDMMSQVSTALTTIKNILNGINVGPSALFWGLDVPSNVPNSLLELQNNKAIINLKSSLVSLQESMTGSKARYYSLYVGIQMTGSWIISGGYKMGIYIDLNGKPSLLVLELGVGVGLQVGFQVGGEIGVMFNSASTFLGVGGYVQASLGGSVFSFGVGFSGNLPMHLDTWDNVGFVFDLNVGLGLPVEFSGGLSYTWEMAEL